MEKTKIERIRKGEVVVVEVIHEDLQDKFNEMQNAIDDCKRAHAEAHEQDTEEFWEKYQRADHKMDTLKLAFWFACRERFKLWGEFGLGVRDGYCLVKIPGGHGGGLNGLLGAILGGGD